MKKTNKKTSLKHNGKHVITTAHVASMLETTVDEVISVFNDHRSSFEEGKHYVVAQIDDNPAFFWTYKGILLFSFAIDTPAAWALYKELIDRCCEIGADKGVLW